jgi:hypothetical protein
LKISQKGIVKNEKKNIFVASKVIRDESWNKILPYHTKDFETMMNQFVWSTIAFSKDMKD